MNHNHGPKSAGAALVAARLLLVCAAAVVAAVHPAEVRAHGGEQMLRQLAGPYRVTVLVARAGDEVDETVTVLDAASLRPVRQALVTATLQHDGGETRGPYSSRQVGDSFEVRYPALERGAGWRVEVAIVGPAGPVTVSHRYTAPPKDWAIGSGWWGVVVMALGIILPAVVFLIVLRPGPHSSAVSPAGTPRDASEPESKQSPKSRNGEADE